MRIAIISLCLSLAALGLAVFATVRTFSDDSPGAPAVASSPVPTWSEADCEAARAAAEEAELYGCLAEGDCRGFAELTITINENYP